MYLGRSPESEDLLLPTRRRVVLQATGETVDERLVAQALLRTGKGPIALVENKCIIHSISMHHALPIQNLTLATWLETERKSRVPSPSEAP
jgi:hypothetical protein